MKFDYANGKTAVYAVTLYGWNVNDIYYVHYLKDAKVLFEKLKATAPTGCGINIYDLQKDVRKAFARV